MSERLPILEALRGAGRCRAALFASSAFDPEFFERVVLAGLLGASADPDEEPERFHAEMRAALARSPVGCIVDATKRRSGRRLPYDLLEVRGVPFGPKVFMTLAAEEARLVVGSGALTAGGFGLHEELFFHARLALASATDRALLREALDFFRVSHELASCRGAELAEALASFERAAASFERAEGTRVPSMIPLAARSLRLVHSSGTGLLAHLMLALPVDAEVVRVGVLAPFVGVDSETAPRGGSESFVLALTRAFVREGVPLPAIELGLSWQNVELAPSRPVATLDGGFRRLWARRSADPARPERGETIEYFTPVRIGPKQLELTDARGRTRREDREGVLAALEAGRAWPIVRPEVAAETELLPALRAAGHEVRLWLHPTSSLVEGEPTSRTLHASLVSVVVRQGEVSRTFVLLGSLRPSVESSTKSVVDGGPLEAAVLMAFDEDLGLGVLVPSLVAFAGHDVTTCEPTRAGTSTVERTGRDDIGRFIESVVHDPEHEMLEIRWSRETGAGPWEARHLGTLVACGDVLPEHPTMLEPFLLDPRCAELVFSMAGTETAVPILVREVAMLPDDARLEGLDLRELLALLGGRIGRERLATVRALCGEGGSAPVLDVLFGRGITPPDVFRVVFRIAHAVADPHADASFAAFAALIDGREGAQVLLELFSRAARRHEITRDEAWFYGSEIVRAVTATRVPDGPDAAKKRALVVGFASEARAFLDAMRPPAEDRPFLADMVSFYGHGDER